MSWNKAGFKPGLYDIWGTPGSDSGAVSSGILKTNQKPTTSDYIVWSLPTGSNSIVPGTLVVIVNGMVQTEEEFEELLDGKSFRWKSPFPITSDDTVRTMFMI